MRRELGLAMLYLLAAGAVSLAVAQPLVESIFLPDSFGGMILPWAMAYDSADDKVYLNSEATRCVIAFDPETGERLARIRVAASGHAMCYVPQGNKLYCAGGGQTYLNDSVVTVIDCAADTVIKFIVVGVNVYGLCYNPLSNKLYSVENRSGTVSVIDCWQDTVIVRLRVGNNPNTLCYNSRNNKVYCVNGPAGTVSVIDGAGDTLITDVTVGASPSRLCYNPRENRVYCSVTGEASVVVIDGASDSVLMNVGVDERPRLLCYDTLDNTIFCTCDTSVSVIDGATNRVVASIGHLFDKMRALAYNPRRNQVYFADDLNRVIAIDGATNQLCDTFQFDRPTSSFWVDPLRSQVFGGNYGRNSVTRFDDSTGGVLSVITTGKPPSLSCHNSRDDKTYLALGRDSSLAVLDCGTNLISAYIKFGGNARSMCYHPQNNRLYCVVDDGTLNVIDGTGDSVVKVIPVVGSPGAVYYNRSNNKVYCYAGNCRDTLTVIDCDADTVVGLIATGAGPAAVCHNPEYNRVYVANKDAGSIYVIDGTADTLMAVIWVAGTPWALAYDSLDNKLYCLNGIELQVIDGVTNYILNSLFFQPAANGLCYSARLNRLYCTSPPDRLTVIDCATDSVLTVVNVGFYSFPAAPTYNSGSDRVYCIHADRESVSVTDAVTNRWLQMVEVGEKPRDLCFNQTGTRAYVANYASSSISVIRDDLIGVADRHKPQASSHLSGPTIVRGVLRLPEGASASASCLLDISGRRAMSLQAGANDVRLLAPGVYFVRADSRERLAVNCQKVVVTR